MEWLGLLETTSLELKIDELRDIMQMLLNLENRNSRQKNQIWLESGKQKQSPEFDSSNQCVRWLVVAELTGFCSHRWSESCGGVGEVSRFSSQQLGSGLRRIGRISDVKVSFDTENARDTLYRVAIDFVLNYCESTASQSAFVLIDGEEAPNFVAGLADNVGLESTRAARMVSAAVAARTRSRFLQAWALEIQGKHSEAMVELFKICAIHKIFPPEEFSPEMEMVARGLEKHLKVDQREFLMNSLLRVCGDGTRRSVAEALGLILTSSVEKASIPSSVLYAVLL
ncbi:hypothetical protein HAX54_031365 [Datura stramonium]|uniref:Uncharacterized protein n=1 Tax=Datura stramonium TaxID=4076 RepID=A0ABS8V945_DATST|nr:hypothetical protein [Datura stramonium]